MNLLLDERLPRKLKGGLPGHNVKTVPEVGWAGIQNGELLPLIESAFDAFLIINGNIKNPPFAAELQARRRGGSHL